MALGSSNAFRGHLGVEGQSMRYVIAGAIVSIMLASIAEAQNKALWTDRVPLVTGAAEHYVAPDGKQTNPGTKEAPWDILSALGGKQEVKPGDIIWLRGGTYKHPDRRHSNLGYVVALDGKEGAPIHVRAYPGERVTIDGGLQISYREPSSYVWIWDLEMIVSDISRRTEQPGSHPTDLTGPAGGLHVQKCTGCKFINLVIHQTYQAIGLWKDAVDAEVHGCLLYDNGWQAPDRGHGHCIYTQNETGVKTISSCIMSALYNGSYTMHAYGSSRAYIDNYLLEDNIAYERGPFLVGGGRPSRGIRAFRNYLYGVNMRIGYATHVEDAELRDNVILNGSLSIKECRQLVEEGNLVLKEGDSRPVPTAVGVGTPTASQVGEGAKVVLIPNKYDPNRAHLVIYNWQKAKTVPVKVAPFLQPGDSFRLLDPKDFFGKPLLEGNCQGNTISVPVDGGFGAFVVVKG